MMELSGVSEVLQRISEIETKIGMKHTAPAVGFSQELQQAMKNSNGTASGQTVAAVSAGKSLGVSNTSASSAPGDVNGFIQTAAKKYNVDPRLVSAVAEAESGFRQSAVSGAGAVGVMQLMPDTAASLGVNPYDEQQNIDGGTKYLKGLLDSFGGDVKKAVAAYNAGSQAVRDYNGVPPYRETQNYVNKVLDLYQ